MDAKSMSLDELIKRDKTMRRGRGGRGGMSRPDRGGRPDRSQGGFRG